MMNKENISNNLKTISSKTQGIKLIAVSKGQNIEKIISAYEAGQRDFGENYVQDFLQKWQVLQPNFPDISWHFLGHLQRNKVKDLIGKVDWIHSLDSLRLAQKINSEAENKNLKQKVLIQIKLSPEASKSGYDLSQYLKEESAIAQLKHLKVLGFMGVPEAGLKEQETLASFFSLKKLLEERQQACVYKDSLSELSMGMSDDYDLALQAGSSMIRLGSIIFGERTYS